jgi:hypothetical protein
MTYRYHYRIDALHVTSDTWYLTKGVHSVNAVSVKHATDKALRQVCTLAPFADRADSDEWRVQAYVSLPIRADDTRRRVFIPAARA